MNEETVVEPVEEKVEETPTEIVDKNPKKKRGVGFTRKNKSANKKTVKLAKKQRKINQARKNKKRRATGSKKK